MDQHDHRDGTHKKEPWVTVAFWNEGFSLIGLVTVFLLTVRVIFSSHRQSSTGSVVVTATCATSPQSQITLSLERRGRGGTAGWQCRFDFLHHLAVGVFSFS